MRTWTAETLQNKVCKRGHLGKYREVTRNGYISITCKDCATLAVKRHRKRNTPDLTSILGLEAYITTLEAKLMEARQQLSALKNQ